MPGAPRTYETKAKNAQEAHEAIRPTDVARRPRDVKSHLDADQSRLYELIWLRTVASQMESAELERTTVDIEAKVGSRILDLRATGTVVKFDGFLTLYNEDRDEAAEDEESRRLPQMSGGRAAVQAFDRRQSAFHRTAAALFGSVAGEDAWKSSASAGPRPMRRSCRCCKDRKYVRLDKKRLVPEDRGRIVVSFLESFFARYVEYDFTAGLEDKLDLISNSEIAWRDVLREFWRDFIVAIDGTKDLKISQVIDTLNDLLSPHLFPAQAGGPDPRVCPTCGNGKLSLKLSKFGAFIGCSNYPECRYVRSLSQSGEGADIGTKKLGEDPETGLDVTVRSGRFGPYLQLGETTKDGEKPKRAGLPKGVVPDEVTFEQALKLLSLPRDVGAHPEDGEMIKAGIGRYGPYVQHGKIYANLESPEDVFTIGLNHAVTLIAEKKAKGPRKRFGADPGRSLGDHPTRGGPITAKKGRYGPYVSHDGVNATLPSDKTPETITLEEATALIDARADRGPAPARPRKAKRAAGGARTGKRPAAKAAAPKKAAASTAKTRKKTQQAAE